MHKNSLLAALGAAALLLSGACNKLPEGRAAKAPAAGEVLLKVSLGDAPGTKVAAQTPINERMIRNVQIFVFRAGSGGDAGSLEIAASSGFDGELEVGSGAYSGLTLKCSTGEREIWAVVNDSADRTARNSSAAHRKCASPESLVCEKAKNGVSSESRGAGAGRPRSIARSALSTCSSRGLPSTPTRPQL